MSFDGWFNFRNYRNSGSFGRWMTSDHNVATTCLGLPKCPRGGGAGIFRMPELTPSPETNKNSLAAVVVSSTGESVEAWLLPGRGISVQIGARPSDAVPARW